MSHKQKGFSLIEVLVGTALFVLFAGGMYESTQYVFKVVYQSRIRILEDEILNEQIEEVRNYAYDDVGILNGVPAGKLARVVTTTRDGIPFEITRTVRNIDDPYDGTIDGTPADLAPVDYKFIDVSVVCSSCSQKQAATMSTIVAPKYLEGNQTTGALFVTVFDANGSAIQGASVHVVATSTSPTVDYTDTTDNAGKLHIVGLAAGYEAYAITVTKDGYTTDQTTPRSASVPNPTKPPVSIIAQAVTQVSFSLDHSSAITFSSLDSQCQPIAGSAFTVQGTKLVGTNPDVLAVNSTVSTNNEGSYTTSTLTWDNYTFFPATYNLIGTIPASPVIIQPGVSQPVTLLLGANYARSLLVTVRDSVTLQPLSNASVNLVLGNYNHTDSTGVGHILQTDWTGGSGQTAMSDETKYASDSGTVDIQSNPGNLTLTTAGNRYATEGIIESSIYDLGVAANFVNIDWVPFSQPISVGSDGLRFQLATSSSTASQWNYVGYDGTSATYYDASHVAINAIHNGDRYVRYKAYLHTDDTASTPTLSDITISYTTSCTPPGQAYFGNLSAGDYTLTVSLADHMTYEDTVAINGRGRVVIDMIAESTIAGDTTPPVIVLGAPADNATVSGSAVAVSAIASDNVGMAGVQFKLDGTNLGSEDIKNPFSFTWDTTEVTSGTHVLTGVARDLAGNLTTSPSITVTVADVTAPTVSLTAPTNNSTVSGPSVSLTATANDTNGVVGVQFKLDTNTKLGSEDTTAPYVVTWDSSAVTPGSHTVLAVARDAAGNYTTSTVATVTVSDVTAPTVTLTAPANNTNVSGSSVTVSATASDNAAVAGVQFKLDTNTKIGVEDVASPYNITWDTTSVAPGSHTVLAVARDAAGNYATSTIATVTVLDVTAPTVVMTAPANNASVSGSSVSLTATASDNVSVAGVQFKMDGAKVGAEDTTSPYAVSWDSTTTSTGAHVLVAVARDTAGNMTTSTIVSVTVLDVTPPTVSVTSPTNNTLVGQSSVNVLATASDNKAVVGVQMKLDGVNLGSEDLTSPYSVSWDPSQTTTGAHILTAVARDAAGNSAESAGVTVNVTDMTSYWKFDEGAGTNAGDAIGGNIGTLQNGPTWVGGHSGSALSFDGANDAVDAGSASALDNLAALSVSTWIKPTSMGEGSQGRIVDKASGTGPTNGWYLRLDQTSSQNYIVFSVDYSGTGSVNLVRKSVAGAVSIGAWQHLVVTWDGSTNASNVHMYINGVEVGYSTTTNGVGSRASDASESFRIGNDKSGAKTFDGVIDDVRLYGRVLSSAEASSIFNGRAW